jgi:hypothetical protein
MQCKSNKALITNPRKVGDILESRRMMGIDYSIWKKKGKPYLQLDEFMEDGWPTVLPHAKVPRREDFPNEDAFDEAISDLLLDEVGDEGLFELLCELAPYLKTGLVLLAADDHVAKAWSVQPGGKSVQVAVVEV